MNPLGVPSLQDASIVFNQVSQVVSDISIIAGLFAAPQWGIFDQSGKPVIVGDSVLAFDNARDSNVSTYPVEGGEFASYNKVQVPFDVKFTFTKGGTISSRTTFLSSLDIAQNSLDLYIGHTPERPYNNITIDHYDLSRNSSKGVTLLTVDVWCKEVRQAPPVQFSNTPTSSVTPIVNPIDPGAANTDSLGVVNGVAPSSQVSTPMMTGSIPGSGIVSPATITSPVSNFTNATGNVQPPSIASPIASTITFDTAAGTGNGVVSGFTSSLTTGATTGYNLSSGAFVPVNQVAKFAAPGLGVVQ